MLVLAPVVVGAELDLAAQLALAAASLVPAVITLHLVENPVRFSQWLAWRPRRGLTLAAGLTAVSLVAAGVAVWSLPGSPAPGGARSSALAAPEAPEVTPDPSAAGPPPPRSRREGRPPRLGSTPRWSTRYGSRRYRQTSILRCAGRTPRFPALKTAADERRWRLVSLTKSTCPPVAMPLWSPDLGRSYRECDTWRDAVLARIRAERPALVVLGATRHYGPEFRFDVRGPEWPTGLGEMVRRIEEAGSRAVVLGPAPHPRADVPDCLSEHLGDVTACSHPAERAIDRRHVQAEAAAAE